MLQTSLLTDRKFLGYNNICVAEIRDNDKILKYIDIPLQHSENRILKISISLIIQVSSATK